MTEPVRGCLVGVVFGAVMWLLIAAVAWLVLHG